MEKGVCAGVCEKEIWKGKKRRGFIPGYNAEEGRIPVTTWVSVCRSAGSKSQGSNKKKSAGIVPWIHPKDRPFFLWLEMQVATVNSWSLDGGINKSDRGQQQVAAKMTRREIHTKGARPSEQHPCFIPLSRNARGRSPLFFGVRRGGASAFCHL